MTYNKMKRVAMKSWSVDTDVLAIKMQLNVSRVQNAIKIKKKNHIVNYVMNLLTNKRLN